MDILIFSSFPEKSLIHSSKTVGVGNYTKATLLSLIKIMDSANFTVFAEVLDKNEEYIENRIKVQRCWKRGNIVNIIKTIIKISGLNAKVVIFPFEMFMFGGLLQLALVMPFLLLLRRKNKKVILIMHQILGDELSVFEQNNLKRIFFKLNKSLFYRYFNLISDKIVVFEEEFKQRLDNSKKVVFIPHGVLTERVIPKEIAKQKLGLDTNKKYVLYFGYLAAYKGVDMLIKIWEKIENVDLIISGSGNPNHMKNKRYQEYVQNIINSAKDKEIVTTGFIPQEMMDYYFSAVDLIIFPYTVFMSSSGPLSHCFSYGKGLLLSLTLRDYFNSPDLKLALDEAKISIDEICFDLEKSIKNKILWSLHNIDKLENFSKKVQELRSWDKISYDYKSLLEQL